MPVRIGVLVSGRGSNLEAILRSVARGEVRRAAVSVVISNRAEARALLVARRYGVPAVAIPSDGVERRAYDSMLARCLEEHGVAPGEGLVLLAGYMRLLTERFVNLYRGRILNIHPSLLPSFPGLHAQRQALEYGVKVTGCTVHLVVPDVDAGPIILQRAVAVRDGDDEDVLSSRILRQEHRLYPEAVKLFVEGALRFDGRRVRVKP